MHQTVDCRYNSFSFSVNKQQDVFCSQIHTRFCRQTNRIQHCRFFYQNQHRTALHLVRWNASASGTLIQTGTSSQ